MASLRVENDVARLERLVDPLKMISVEKFDTQTEFKAEGPGAPGGFPETLHLAAPDEVFDEERILGPEAHAEDRLHAEVVAALERSGQRQRQEQLSKRQRAEETVPVSSDASTSD